MVHALREAHRVLIPHGTIIDVRPLSIDVPLEIIYTGGCETAGIIDMSPEAHSDIASDQAINSVVRDGIYSEFKVEYFNYALYWNTVKDMEEDIEENWKDDVIISESTWQKARELVEKRLSEMRIRVALRMKMATYEKQGRIGIHRINRR